MIEYVETFLGLESGYLANSDFGIALVFLLLVMSVFMVFKVFTWWFDKLFG